MCGLGNGNCVEKDKMAEHDLIRRNNRMIKTGEVMKTPQRVQWMRDNYATCGLHVSEIIRVLNEMPGAPYKTARQIHTLATTLGVKRMTMDVPRNGVNRGFHIINNDVWTEERKQYLRDHWMDPVSIHDLLRQLNAIPSSKQIGGYKAVKYQAKRLKLPSRYEAAMQAHRIKAKEVAKTNKQNQVRVWTPERCNYLREIWQQLLTLNQMKQMIEEKFPGNPIASRDSVRRQASTMNLPVRPLEMQRASISLALREIHKEKRGGGLTRREQQKLRAVAREAAKANSFESASRHKPKTATFSRGPNMAPIMRIIPPQPKEQSPETADNAINKKLEKARAMLKAKKDPYDVHLAAKLPLREVYRLQAEMKGRI